MDLVSKFSLHLMVDLEREALVVSLIPAICSAKSVHHAGERTYRLILFQNLAPDIDSNKLFAAFSKVRYVNILLPQPLLTSLYQFGQIVRYKCSLTASDTFMLNYIQCTSNAQRSGRESGIRIRLLPST